jgi:hypothetical protein
LPHVSGASNVKAGTSSGRADVLDLHALYTRSGRAAPHSVLEPFERLAIAFGEDGDLAVRAILDPPMQPLARGRRLNEKAVADTLYATTDEVTAAQ